MARLTVYATSNNQVSWRITSPDWVSGKTYRIKVQSRDSNVDTPNYETARDGELHDRHSASRFEHDLACVEGIQCYRRSPDNPYDFIRNRAGRYPNNVKQTLIRMYYITDGTYYWHQVGGWNVGQSTWMITDNLTSGGTWWSYNFGNPNKWASGQTYYLNSISIDKANNTQVIWSTTTFQVDTLPPHTRVSIRRTA